MILDKITQKDEKIDKFSVAVPKNTLDKNKNVLTLDLSDKKYEIKDLDELDSNLEYRQYFLHLNILDVQNNRLSYLKLIKFNYLEKLSANGNMISKVDLNLPKLKKLNLSSNMLDRIPELTQCPNLEELRLDKNSISKITYEDFKCIKATVTTIELTMNKIDFAKAKEFFDFAEVFGKNMKRLRSLNISKNPFATNKIYNKEYTNVFVFYCESLNAIDNKTIDSTEKKMSKQIISTKNKILEAEKEFGHLLKNEVKMENYYGIKPNSKVTLDAIKKGMERYQTVSRMGQNNFGELKEIIEKYIEHANMNPDEDDDQDGDELDEFDVFLESCNIIIENTASLEKPLFDIVANFAIIKKGKFSNLALTFFKHHLSSNEKAKEIEEVIQSTIIAHINLQTENENIPSSIIKGLQAFAHEPKFKKMINDLILKLRKVVEYFREMTLIGSKTLAEENKKRDVISSCLSFIAILCEDKDVLNIIVSSDDFLETLADHLRNLLKQAEDIVIRDERGCEMMINILIIIRSLCMAEFKHLAMTQLEKENIEAYEASIKKILAVGLKDKVELELNKKIEAYIKMLSDSNSSDQDKISKEMKFAGRCLLANVIRCYGGLIRRIEDKTKLNFSGNSVTMAMLGLMTASYFTDPVIISALCDYICFAFENTHIQNNESQFFVTIVSKLYSLKYVLTFLAPGAKYNQACFVADKLGQNTLSHTNVPIEFENMNSEVMHQMIISIVRLITFFGRNSQGNNPNMKQICIDVCADLNELGRDSALTGCLKVPSDEVKKAVVKCLFYVDSSEFDKGEISGMYQSICGVNLMAGDIEEVVATIFIIFGKAFKEFIQDSSAREKVESNKESLIIAIDILLKNSERTTNDDKETEQKLMLSIACVVFLINCSCFESIKKFYADRKIATKIHRVLNFEELKFNEIMSLPIEIERTRAGWNMINLHECFRNEYPLYPYSYVFMRTIMHIADMMMNIPYDCYDIPTDKEFYDIINQLKKEIAKREADRVDREGFTFKKLDNYKKSKKIIKESYDMIYLNSAELKEEQYKFITLFPALLLFLLGKTTQSKMAEFEKIWEDKFDPKFQSLNYSLSEMREVEVKEEKLKLEDSYLNSEKVYTKIKRIMREEPMKSASSDRETMTEYDHIRFDIPNSYKYTQDVTKMRRLKAEETAHNPYIRGLVIASFLRAIYAVLEYSAENGVKFQMIEILKKGNNIKDISMLVDSTKLVEFNIASKYLQIMRIILENSKNAGNNNNTRANNDSETEYLNQIGVISFMIRKMINVYRNSLRIENEDHKIFLSDLSKCSAVICNEIFSLHYTNERIREKTMSNMINYDTIKIFIITVKEYMNKDAESVTKEIALRIEEDNLNSKNKRGDILEQDEIGEDGTPVGIVRRNIPKRNYKEDESLNEMIFLISYIIGEYMSKCKDYSYQILESFTRSYIFDNVKMRKTYLREIIHTSKMSDLKTKIEKSIKIRVYFLTRCLLNDFQKKEDYITYLMLTDYGLETIETENNFDTPEWELKEFKRGSLRIRYDEIIEIFQLELSNRVIVQTKRYECYGFFFLKVVTGHQMIEMITNNKADVIIYPKQKVFPSLEEEPTDVAKADKEKETDDKNDEDETANNPVIVFAAVNEKGSLFGMFSGMFKEREFMPNAKILVFQKKRLTIYQENMDAWKNLNPEFFSRLEMSKLDQPTLFSMYNEKSQYNLDKLTGAVFSKTDVVNLQIGSTNLEIQVLGDLSYTKLKKAITPVVVEKKFHINSNDIYGKI